MVIILVIVIFPPDFEVKATKISKTTDGYLALRAPLPLHLPINDNNDMIII